MGKQLVNKFFIWELEQGNIKSGWIQITIACMTILGCLINIFTPGKQIQYYVNGELVTMTSASTTSKLIYSSISLEHPILQIF